MPADVAEAGNKNLKDSFLDRLTLTPARIAAIAQGLEDIAALPDPVGAVMAEWTRPNGMTHRAGSGSDRRHRHHL